MHTLHCIILSYLKYSDNDAVLHCFSLENGYESFFCRGIYAAKNRRKAYLFPLNEVRIYLSNQRNTSSLKSVSKIEQLADSYSFADPRLNTMLFFAADFLNQILRRESGAALYKEIQQFKKEAFSGNANAHIALVFRMLHYLGIAPLFGKEEYLNPEAGTFLEVPVHTDFSSQISKLWKEFESTENGYQIILGREMRKQLLKSLMIYYRFHFTDFREPASLDVLQQIYD